MRLAAIVDHRGRSATAIETSVLFVDSENAARRQLVPRFSFAPCFPRSANNYATADTYVRTVDNNGKDIK